MLASPRTNAFSSELIFYVNGSLVVENNPRPEMTLLHYLRYNMNLTGPKLGCGEGGCGACTVTVAKYNTETKSVETNAVNACLAPLVSVDGAHVITVEGLGNRRTGYHPVQSRVADFHGSQCGYCTPGIVMALYAFLQKNPTPTRHELEEAMDGNLCRCTGYRPLNDAVKSFAVDNQQGCPCAKGDSCCRNKSFKLATKVDLTKPDANLHALYKNARKEMKAKTEVVVTDSKSKMKNYQPYNPAMDDTMKFPADLRQGYSMRPLKFTSDTCTWYRPTSLQQLLFLKDQHPAAKIVVGNTEVGVDIRIKKQNIPVRISGADIHELNEIKVDTNGISFGSSVSLTRMKETYDAIVADATAPAGHKRTAHAFLNQIRWFSSTQIRNVCSVGSNVMNASPISDLSPLLQATHSQLLVSSHKNGHRTRDSREFFLSYKKVNVTESEVLISIFVPFCKTNQYLQSYKQARRRDDDIAIVTAGFGMTLSDNGIIEDICLSYGGMAAVCASALQTQTFLKGKAFTLANIKASFPSLQSDFNLKPGTPGGMEEFRMTLAASFLLKFFLMIGNSLNHADISDKMKSGGQGYERGLSWGRQVYQVPKDKKTSVGKGQKHLSARAQASGEAKYTTDLADPKGCLHAVIVGSKVASGRILSIDPSVALGVEGVVAFFDHKAVKNNKVGDVIKDEWVFAPEIVRHVGEPVGVIVAHDRLVAEAAALLVRVEYETLPALFTIDDAIAKESYHNVFGDTAHSITDGDVEAEFKKSDVITLKGQLFVGGQEHFYLETHNALVVPREDSDITIYASTQNPSVTQQEIAHVLGMDANRVTCIVKRLGGGFGGKETRSVNVASYAAVAAHALNRPVRINLERDMDMHITGQRHPFKAEYTVGFTQDGKLRGLDVNLYNNAGYSLDLSMAVMERALFHVDNVYKWPTFRAVGRCCKTNLPSNTAFRGFGGPQGLLFTEAIIERVAKHLNFSVNEIRERNFYQEGEPTHFGQKLTNWTIPETWERMKERADVKAKEDEVAKFNATHRFKKRGISCIPTKFGIAFTYLPLNQGGALVHIYKDGSVLVSHGGTEMGQGLNTKMVQVAAEELGVPLSFVHVNETGTDKVPNTSPTAASFSSDINGLAVKDACTKLKKRLMPVAGEGKTWQETVMAAYLARISLSATGYCKIDGIGYNFQTGEGTPFRYFTNSSAVSVVEVDTLTGDFTTLSSDIVMDLGASINPVIDIGQIEGAFVQGMGWCTMEEMVWGDNQHPWVRPGYLASKGPGAYKIPGFNDTPLDFNVYLLRDRPNPITLHSSKAVGEPPFFLGSSVFFAIKDAIQAARAENGQTGYFPLNAPATAERIRMACCDDITERFVNSTSVHDNFFQTKGSF